MIKTTPFYENHIRYGAKLVDFVGYNLPIQYKNGIVAEVKNIRENAGIFDVSHMGEIEIKGTQALKFTNHIVTNDVERLNTNQILYTVMCYPNGGIVDDLLVYRRPESYFLVVNGANVEKDYKWICEKAESWDVQVKNLSDDIAQIAIQGPKSENIVKKLTDYEIENLPYYHSDDITFASRKVLLSRTGYTGEDGFEIYLNKSEVGDIWQQIMTAGEEFNLSPSGLAARDILRMEMVYCLYGNDISEETSPLEASLNWVVKMKKDDFIGKNFLIEQKKNGIKRKLVPFIIEGRSIPRKGYKIYREGEVIGEVTSGTHSPSIEKSIGIGYVNKEFSKSGNIIEIEIRSKKTNAEIIKSPFYTKGSRK